MERFHSNGKLLLTGEYAVLDGAMALALPTKPGQSMEVKENNKAEIYWKSLDEKGNIWFETSLKLKKSRIESNSSYPQGDITKKLLQILNEAHLLNPKIFSSGKGFDITTKLEFNRNWGLGSSSTLINNIASWFRVDPYTLLEKTFGGSGYDIAAAQNSNPITYQITKEGRSVLKTNFEISFKDQLFFVYLNQKQNSRQAIAHYRNQPKENLDILVEKISALSQQFAACINIQQFELLVEIHESLISGAVNLPKIKSLLFSDYPRAIKSLGGWGGDFILATGGKKEQNYFLDKGYKTIIPYSEMIL